MQSLKMFPNGLLEPDKSWAFQKLTTALGLFVSLALTGCNPKNDACSKYVPQYSAYNTVKDGLATSYIKVCDFGFGRGEEVHAVRLGINEKNAFDLVDIIKMEGNSDLDIKWINDRNLLIKINGLGDVVHSINHLKGFSIYFAISDDLSRDNFMRNLSARESDALQSLISHQSKLSGDYQTDKQIFDASAAQQREQYDKFYNWYSKNNAIYLNGNGGTRK